VFDSKIGAYGNRPNDDKQPLDSPLAPLSQQFSNPIQSIARASRGAVSPVVGPSWRSPRGASMQRVAGGETADLRKVRSN
jgi:hypothetical protein